MSMTSMNDDVNPISKGDQTGSKDFFYKGTASKAPLGVVEKVDGAVKYVVPNSNYMVSTQNKTSQAGIMSTHKNSQAGSPRSTIYT